MNKVETVRAAFSFPSPEEAEELLSDEFQSTDEVGSPPMDKAAWVGMGEMMKASFPDVDYVIEDIREEGDGVRVEGYFVGTFANDFDLTAMGMGVIPASGKKIRWPNGTALVSVEGGKVKKVHSIGTGPDAGLAGFLKPLGVG